jgi:ankyrin repeat protein
MACVARHQLQRDTLTSTLAVLTNLKSLNLLGVDDHRSRDWEKPILSTILSLNRLERVTLPPFIKDWPSLKTLPCLKKLVVSNPDAVIAVEHLSEGIFSKEHCLEKAPGYFGWYISLLEELPIDLDVAKSDGTSYSFLHSACRSRKDTGIVAHMLTLRHKIKCFDPDYRNAIGQTPLMLTKSIEIATALLDAGADVNACFYEERFISTPLSVAILGGKLALARLLLTRGASFILGSPLPLIAAADHTDPQIRDLAYHHAPALLPKIQSDEHLFAAAALFFRFISPQAMVATLNSLKKEKLLQLVQYRDDDGRSVLHSLCARRPCPPGSEAVIQRLLDAGADPIQKDSTGLSPLWNAIKSAPEAIVRLLMSRTKLTPETDSLGTDKPSCLALLIDKGYHNLYMEAIPNFQAAHFSVGRKPLAYDICLRCEPEDIRQIVKDVGPIDFNCKRVGSSGDGDYPIFAALATGESRMLQVLLEHHADPNVFNEFGLSALMISLACNEEGACRLLLDAGADPNPVAVPKYARNLIPIKQMAMVKQTPLTYAIRKYRVNDIQALLEKGADPNLPNGEGFTPLTLLLGALSTSHKRAISDILRLLLQHNADVNVADAKDTLPLIALLRTDWKVLSNEKQIFLTLLEAGAKPVSWKRYEALGRQNAEKICPSALEAAICWRSS